jgi:Cu-Zn family superoxide dismutase
MTRTISILFLSLLATACASTGGSKPAAEAELKAASGSSVSGSVTFAPEDGKLRVQATVSGLAPGEHGFHVHEVGDCSAADATSAKGHFNPAGKGHGHHGGHERHAGDLPNLVADAQGKASYSALVDGVTVGGGAGDIMGRSVVIHADPDDYKSQPAGNSGKRVACGVIKTPFVASGGY